MRFAAVLDGTRADVARQARILGGFLRRGLAGELAGETLVFYQDPVERGGLVGLCPTRDVRLVRTTARRHDAVVEVLSRAGRDGATGLFLFAGGAGGTELATRLAYRSHGAVATDVLSAEAGPERLACRKTIYSGHLVGRFELSPRPWCVSVASSWSDEPGLAPAEHCVLSDTDETGLACPAPFEDLELEGPPADDDLATRPFLVVAGRGAGSRDGVARIARAARHMGAAFGVSRPVAMNAWASPDRLVGVSGTRCAPALCIVAGASGAPAFFWGIEKARFIVAIDPDEKAPLVRSADVAVLDDAVAVVEALADIVVAARGRA